MREPRKGAILHSHPLEAQQDSFRRLSLLHSWWAHPHLQLTSWSRREFLTQYYTSLAKAVWITTSSVFTIGFKSLKQLKNIWAWAETSTTCSVLKGWCDIPFTDFVGYFKMWHFQNSHGVQRVYFDVWEKQRALNHLLCTWLQLTPVSCKHS